MERPTEATIGAPRGTPGPWRRGAWIALVLAVAVAVAAPLVADSAEEQLSFGADMARRGLWKEALFRFQQADRLDPDNPHILNNLAVSYEALGLFDKALETYREALRVGQEDERLKANYSRFVEFYQNFRPQQESEGAGESQPAAEEGDG